MSNPLLTELSSRLPCDAITTAPERIAPRLVDERRRFQGKAMALALPATVEEAAIIISACQNHRVPMVPQAGNTSLVGGATPMSENALIIACDRLNAVRAVNGENFTMTAETGCTLDELHAAARTQSRVFPLWIASSASARLGGMISTNAGGLQALRYGTMRNLILGIEAVLPDGCIYHGLHGLRKRNMGYDISQLITGAEGTLGFVTAATLRLCPLEQGQAVCLISMCDIESVMRLYLAARTQLGEVLSAYELISGEALRLLAAFHPELKQPFDNIPTYAVLLALSGGESDAQLQARLLNLLQATNADDAVLAQGLSHANSLWALREHIPSAQRRAGPSIKHDISLPADAIAPFIARSSDALRIHLPRTLPVVFGHVGDGNLHYNLGLAPSEPYTTTEDTANQILFTLVCEYGGSISAEHGIGRLRRATADALHDPVERDIMRRIKASLDPHSLFNPGVLL